MKFRRLVGENPRKRELENPGSSDVDLQTFDATRYMGVWKCGSSQHMTINKRPIEANEMRNQQSIERSRWMEATRNDNTHTIL